MIGLASGMAACEGVPETIQVGGVSTGEQRQDEPGAVDVANGGNGGNNGGNSGGNSGGSSGGDSGGSNGGSDPSDAARQALDSGAAGGSDSGDDATANDGTVGADAADFEPGTPGGDGDGESDGAIGPSWVDPYSKIIYDCPPCALACSDDDPDTLDAALSGGGCLHLPYVPNSASSPGCDSTTPCDGDGCEGRAVACRDNDPCTADACDPATGTCSHVAILGCGGVACALTTDCPADAYCAFGRCAARQPAGGAIGPVFARPAGVLRVVSYNVLNGFAAQKTGFAPERKAQIAAWLAALAPDVVAFEELNDMTADSLQALAAQWGHGHVAIGGNTSYRLGFTSAKPIDSSSFLPAQTSMGELYLQVDGIRYLVVHLNPHSYAKREAEAQAVAMQVQTLASTGHPVVVLGDFNALSAFDLGYYGVENPMPWLQVHSTTSQKQGPLSAVAMQTLLSVGLVDVVAKHRVGTTPTPSFVLFNPPWGARFDYILTTKDLATKSVRGWVANYPHRYGWSDHLPIVADFAP